MITRHDVEPVLDAMRRQYSGTPAENDLLDWAADGILGYLTEEGGEAWDPEPDGYQGHTIRQACAKEFVFRLGTMMPDMESSYRWSEAADAADDRKSRRRAAVSMALADRIAAGEGVAPDDTGRG